MGHARVFVVSTLPDQQVSFALPLLRAQLPELDLHRLRQFAFRLGEAGGPRRAGMLGVWRQGREFPCGIVCYRVLEDLAAGEVLLAEHFVAMDLLDPDAVMAALIAEVEALALRMGCAGVRSIVHGPTRTVMARLLAAGYQAEGLLMSKQIS